MMKVGDKVLHKNSMDGPVGRIVAKTKRGSYEIPFILVRWGTGGVSRHIEAALRKVKDVEA